MSGKGSAPRPFDVPREDYESSYDRIFGKRERLPYVPPPLPDAVEKAIDSALRSGRGAYILRSDGSTEAIDIYKEPPCPAD